MKRTPKHTKSQSKCLLKSFIVGFCITLGAWLVLTLVFSLIMSKIADHTVAGGVMSVVTPVLSLFAGGFAVGKTDKSKALLLAIVLAALFLGLSYVLTSAFSLSKNFNGIIKIVQIVAMFLSSLAGAKISVTEKGRRRPHRR